MPALDLAQEEIGFLTPETMSEVAIALNVDPGYVEGVATFYTLFHTQPVGKHRMYICTNLACMLRGAEEIVAHAIGQVGVERVDQVSADGLFSIEEVECLGVCEFAPAMRLDHRFWHDLTPDQIDSIVRERRGGATAPGRTAPATIPAAAPAAVKKPRTKRNA